MTSFATPEVKEQELVQFGMVESAGVNSINDFTSSKLNQFQTVSSNDNENFINTFICHLIFYAIFCISLVLYIFIDLGLSSFVDNIFKLSIDLVRKMLYRESSLLLN